MKLEVGMYVRTKYSQYKDDNIGIISEFYMKNQFWMKLKDGTKTLQLFDDVINSSFNIKDLIQEDDYINGHRVVYKDNDIIQVDCAGWIHYDGNLGTLVYEDYEEEIETIVTKEQFNSREYKIQNKEVK